MSKRSLLSWPIGAPAIVSMSYGAWTDQVLFLAYIPFAWMVFMVTVCFCVMQRRENKEMLEAMNERRQEDGLPPLNALPPDETPWSKWLRDGLYHSIPTAISIVIWLTILGAADVLFFGFVFYVAPATTTTVGAIACLGVVIVILFPALMAFPRIDAYIDEWFYREAREELERLCASGDE